MNKSYMIIGLSCLCMLSSFILLSQSNRIFQQLDSIVRVDQNLSPIIDSADYYFTQDRTLATSLYDYYYVLAKRYPQWHFKGDTVRTYQASVYNWHAFELLGYDIDLSERLVDTAFQISSAIGDSVTMQRCYYTYGTIARIIGENYKALDYYDRYVKYYSEPFDSVAICDVYYQIGSVYTEMGELASSTDYLLECVRLDEGMGRYDSPRWAYEALAINYRQLRQYDKALDYNELTSTIFERIKDTIGIGRNLYNRGNIYADIDSIERAIALQKEAVDLLSNHSSKHFLASAYENLGLTYLKINKDALAEENLQKGLDLSLIHNKQKQVNISKTNLSRAKLKMNKSDEAIELLSEVYDYAKDNQEIAQLSEITHQLSEAYEMKGELAESIKFRKEYEVWQDSLFSKNTIKSINNAEAKYQAERKESEIQRLSLEDNLNQVRLSRQRIALGSSAIGLALLSFLLYRLFGQKKHIQSQNALISKSLGEKEILLKEIHHRVKNNMQVISSLLRIQSNQTEDAGALEALKDGQSRVQSMSLIHQDLYQHDNLKGIYMADYIGKLSQSLLQTYQLTPDRVDIQTNIAELTLDVDTVVPLGLIINELITNAIKYAFPNNRKGLISISFHEEIDKLILIVKDNGVGLPEKVQNDGFGSGLIQAFANKLDAQININSYKGTEIVLTIVNYQKVMS